MFWRLQQFTPNLANNFKLIRKQFFWFSVASRVSLQSFSDIVMPLDLQKDLTSRFPTLTEIQQQTIDRISSGKDLIGIAKTGSGKTLAYGLPVLLKLAKESSDNEPMTPKYLIIAPTRELTQQIREQLQKVCSFLGLKIVCVYGGEPRGKQLFNLSRGVDVLVGTPGRLLDFIQADKIKLGRIQYLTLDEADRILEVGYEQQILKIASYLKSARQTTLFSATWDNKVSSVFKQYMSDKPQYVQIGESKVSLNMDIKQQFKVLEEDNKADTLIEIISKKPNERYIIFVNMKMTCREIQKKLKQNGINSSMLNGDMDQNYRNMNLNEFKTKKTNVLIATDVAARGLDINDVNYVINYDAPDNIQSYVHRIGRTARAGKQGTSITFLSWQANLDMAKELVKLLTQHNIQLPKELTQILPYLSVKKRKGGISKSINSSRGNSFNNPRTGERKYFNKQDRYNNEWRSNRTQQNQDSQPKRQRFSKWGSKPNQHTSRKSQPDILEW